MHTLLWSGNLHLLAHAVPLQDARKLVGIFCRWLERGTRRALISPCICPLCSAFSAQGLTTTVKQLQSLRVCQVESTTSVASHGRQSPAHSRVLLVPSSGSCSSTAFSNSHSCRSIMSWASSPTSVVKIRWMTIDLSSLHCEVDTDMWSANIVGTTLCNSAPLPLEPKYIAAHYGHDESFIVKCGYQQLLLLVHEGNNCTGSHSDLIHMLCDQEGIALPKTRDVSHIWGHVEPGRPKGIFFRINTSPSVSTW